MAAIRADFTCLALNFTLCSVFTGRFFTGDLAPRSSFSKVPSGFVLPDSSLSCSPHQWAVAVNALAPSLRSRFWSQSICAEEAALIGRAPSEGSVWINGSLVQPLHQPFCASPLVRKGSRLFPLCEEPHEKPRGASCARAGTLEVCHRTREYAPGEAPNPFGEDASFILSPDARKAKRPRKPVASPTPPPSRAAAAASKPQQASMPKVDEAPLSGRGQGVGKAKQQSGTRPKGIEPLGKGAEAGSRGGRQEDAGKEGKAVGPQEKRKQTKEPRKQKQAKEPRHVVKAIETKRKQVKRREEEDEEEEDRENGGMDTESIRALEKLTKSDPKTIINLAVSRVNAKDYKTAIQLYDMLGVGPWMKEKLVGRGTAHLFLGSKDKALEDFTEAVELFPSDADVVRRRASVYDSLGMKHEALEDLSRAIELDPSNEESRHLRGALAFNLQDFWTAIEDFNVSVQRRPTDPVVLNALGLALMGGGRYGEAAEFYTIAVRNVPTSASLWSEKGRAHKELAQVAQAEESLRRALQLEEGTVLYHRLASLKHLTGHHKEALRVAEQGLEDNPGDIELNFLAAASKHARGDFIEAIRHYEKLLGLNAGQNSGMLSHQFLSFYLREICAYTMAKGDLPLDRFLLDQDMTPVFKVHWVKKMNPLELFPGYRPVTLGQAVVRRGPVDPTILTRDALKLIRAADRIGSRTQYFVHGFMPNRRQYRMAGLAALDLMQRARATWEAAKADALAAAERAPAGDAVGTGGKRPSSLKGLADEEEEEAEAGGAADDWEHMVGSERGGLNGPGSKDGGATSGKRSKQRASREGARLIKGWRDMFNNLVRWRQLSEPVDTIAWIDGLGKEYIEGFGSITAMTVGQMENLKYYPEYKRGFELMKQRLYESEEAMNATGAAMHISRSKKGPQILAATTRKALWEVVGENFYVTTQCHSYTTPGKIMNGTQLTLVESLKSHDFAIRTPVTPDRMVDFGHEMQRALEEMQSLYLDSMLRKENPSAYQQGMQDCVLRIGYYWYQLMPLARGSAMVGLIGMHGLSLAANMEITEYIPRGLQIDWESILAPKFEMFREHVAYWFFANTKPAPFHLPNVMDTLPTIRHVIAALSYEEDD